jgi:hypothetical protein
VLKVAPHAEGFAVTWSAAYDEQAVRALRRSARLKGLTVAREWSEGLVIQRYRNELETLQLLLGILGQFGTPYSLEPALEQFLSAGRAEERLLATVRAAAAPAPIPPTLAEFGGHRDLFGYQCAAVARHLLIRNSADFSVPGSGKTTVALAYWASARREDNDLGLMVIGPLSCFRPWEDEFSDCFGRPAKSLRLRGTVAERGKLLRLACSREVVLCSYQTAWREQAGLVDLLRARPWLLVLDEAHYVKSMSGVLSGAVRTLAPHASRRMVLTGTPMPRSPEDLWSPFTFLWPGGGLMGNADQHALRCKRPADEVCDAFKPQLSPFFHRTCKSDLDLPAVDQQFPQVLAEDVPPSQRLLIRLIEQTTLAEVDRLPPRDRRHLARWRRARIIRLLQAASNPMLLAEAINPTDLAGIDADTDDAVADDPDAVPLTDERSRLAAVFRTYAGGSVIPAKVEYVVRRCRELVWEKHKVVIWTVFLGNVALLEQLLVDLRPLVVTGEVPAYEAEDDESGEDTREQRITQFKNDRRRMVLIANAAACSESISLHKVCQHAVYLERSFNAAHFLQSMDRIHRQGMPAGTTAHIEIPFISCAVERVLNRRLRDRQRRLYDLLDDPLPVVGFDDSPQRGLFDLSEYDDIEELFEEVLEEIRRGDADGSGG